MAFTQTDLDNIRSCIASGVMVTRFADGSEVRYQTLSEMMSAEVKIAGDIAGAAPNATPRRRTVAYGNGL